MSNLSGISNYVRMATEQWNIRGIPRFLYATRHLLLGEEPKVYELGNGIQMYLNPDDYVQCMMFYNRYGRETLEVFRSFVRPGDIVIDVGAHVGFFTLFLGELVTCQGRVYSFEPDVRARKSLERSVAASKMEWVTVSPFALASKSGTTRFYLARGLGSSSAVKGEQQIDATETVVSTISL